MASARFFSSSILVTIIGLIASYFIGIEFSGPKEGFKTVFFVFVLSILEISLSFDNAVVNATILKRMTPKWRHRFITWGILIAVFGMRLIFPLAIISLVAHLNPLSALSLAIYQPTEYERIMTSVHTEINGFGGFFLLMVCLKFFFDSSKEVHWIRGVEAFLSKFGKIEAVEIGMGLLFLLIISNYVDAHHRLDLIIWGIAGITTFICIEGLGEFLQLDTSTINNAERASFGMFLYLEVIDASFSFDGVLGAFAITNNLFLIAIGLGIGAMFVRSLTIMLVELGTLNKYRYLEHGAFWAIGALAVLMIIGTFKTVPEIATGLIGFIFITMAFISSRSYVEKIQK
ncbi:MAG: hypothetical protein A4S09_13275 [Proteobacteria bacterium SG_bin7]|nr:MAG: hypothetical protein A4S09_13275 [Proteobacteria bacterium SG_bin7]